MPPVLQKEENYKAKGQERSDPVNCFFALLFLAISSVSTEQSQICVKNQHHTQENKLKVRFGDLWWYRPNFPMKTPSLRLDLLAQGNLLQECERKFVELLDNQKLPKLCSDAGFIKEIGKGQFFITLEEEGPEDADGMWRAHTTSGSRDVPSERVDSWKPKAAQSWMWRSTFIKDVIVLIS